MIRNRIIIFISSLVLMSSLILNAQSKEGLIQLEFKNYVTKATMGQVEGEGEMHEGLPHGKWEYFLVYDHNIMYYSGNYDHGKRSGVWNNYALIPPMGYNNNYGFTRSTETWKDDKLYRFKMGQDNLLIIIEDGLGEPYVSELKRLDEAFENSYRRTHGKTVTPEFGESVESLQSRLIPMIRQELLKSGQKSELRSRTLYGKLKLHEQYDSGMVLSSLVQNWDKTTLYSKEIYQNEVLSEKTVFLSGDPSNFIEYKYEGVGGMLYMRQYMNDTIPTGRWIENYPGGEKKSQGSYLNGKRNGKWKYWDEEGNLETVKYKNGHKQE